MKVPRPSRHTLPHPSFAYSYQGSPFHSRGPNAEQSSYLAFGRNGVTLIKHSNPEYTDISREAAGFQRIRRLTWRGTSPPPALTICPPFCLGSRFIRLGNPMTCIAQSSDAHHLVHDDENPKDFTGPVPSARSCRIRVSAFHLPISVSPGAKGSPCLQLSRTSLSYLVILEGETPSILIHSLLQNQAWRSSFQSHGHSYRPRSPRPHLIRGL